MQTQKQFIIILFLFLVIVEASTPVNDVANNTLTATSFSPFNVSATGGNQTIRVATSRYSVFNPWLISANYSFKLSGNFTVFALLLNNGLPAPGKNITFNISANGTLKSTQYNLTRENGLASVSYNTLGIFTNRNDTQYGNWTITASLTNNTAVTDSTNMSLEGWANTNTTTCGTQNIYCHRLNIITPTDSNNISGGNYPHSPFTGGYGNDTTFMEAAHQRSSHSSNNYRGCYICHPGYSINKTGLYGSTNDVHKNRTCDYCHGNWTYIRTNLTLGGGAGVPKIPSCYDCHPIYNNNLTNISTLADLIPGPAANVTGKNISVYSYNFDNGTPLTAHNGTESSLIASVPCVVCHGPAHNISKPDPIPANTNNFTEYTQCTACHNAYKRHNDSVSCTVCHSQDAHAIKVFSQSASYISLNRTNPNPARGNCTNCHQNSTFLKILLQQNLSGAYSGSDPPQIPEPVNHSNDINAGIKWNQTPGYWNNSQQLTWCLYCHGITLHNSTALGRPSLSKGNNAVNSTISANTSWCALCHWQGYSNGTNTYNDTVGTFNFPGEPLLVPPEITGNATFGANQSNPSYFNHSSINKDDSSCKNCHGSLTSSVNITGFMHNVVAGGGANCINCHDINGSGAPQDKRITASSMKQGVHANLNSNATNSTSLDPLNKACWACHGNGSEPAGHPLTYKTPKNCNNNDCHSISQSQYNETMIYSHFQNASLNSNPNNVTNYNITTTEQCQNCHINSLITTDNNSNLALASHYGSKDNLVDSFNCIYCHLDKDNSEDWGNATLINKDRTGTIEVNKEKNNLTVFEGQTVYLGEGYSLKLIQISTLRGDALIQIMNKDIIVDQAMVGRDNPYTYEREVTIDNATFKTPAVTVRINSIFTGAKESFITLEAFRPRKTHTEKESNNSDCFACHLYRYSNEKERYKVIDREAKDNGRDIIYYTGVLLDHKLENMSKIYSNDEDYVFGQLGKMGKFISVPHFQKYLEDGQIWQIADNYSLKFRASSTDRQAWLEFKINNETVEEDVVSAGSVFTYVPGVRYKGYADTNMTILTANVSNVFLGQKDFIVLQDSQLLSTQVLKTTANTTQFGYNSSWLHPGDRFTLGKIPESLHTPNLFFDTRDWADCVGCHDSSKNLRIPEVNAISSRLGKHSTLNAEAPDNPSMSDSIDKACLACHTDGTEPNTHSPTYVTPRNCTSCHTYQDKPTYGAVNLSDEAHGYFSACELCHMPRSHEIIRPQILPSISEANLSRSVINSGESVKLTATAEGGIGMKIRSAEYFIDITGSPGHGIPLKPIDGIFDSQVERLVTEINTSGISTGTHTIYIHSMERDNRWGEFYPVNFTIVSDPPVVGQDRKNVASLDFGSIIISLMIVYLIISKRR
ncbi:MAG: S-layer protein domain-containing protein [Candidatus Methanoperedens sp.]|nr:S-layer protein domain-containing protein [Candidatus Methanoperedens sp.]